MFINSFISRNRRSSRVRRNSRRDIRRRFFIFALPLLLIGALGGAHFLNANAADAEVFTTLNITTSDAVDEYINSTFSNLRNNDTVFTITASFYKPNDDFNVSSNWYDTRSDLFRTYNFSVSKGHEDVIQKTIFIPAGKYRLNYLILGRGTTNNPNWGIDGSYAMPKIGDNIKYNDYVEYADSYIEVEVLSNGTIVNSDGTPFTLELDQYDYEQNRPYVEVDLSSYKNKSIPENEKLVVNLIRGLGGDELVASGETQINELGRTKVYLNNYQPIRGEYSGSWFCIEYYVKDSNGNIDPLWTNWNCKDGRSDNGYSNNYDPDTNRWFHNWGYASVINDRVGIMAIGAYNSTQSYYWMNSRYPISWEYVWDDYGGRYFVPAVIKSEYRKDLSDAFDKKTASNNTPSAVNEMHLAQSVNDIINGGHYIIVAKNNVDGAYYALSAGSNSHAIKLTDLNDSNLNSYKISNDTLKNSDYVFTVRSSEIDGSSAKAKFLSNIISDSGRPVVLKLGSSHFEFDEMFNSVGGAAVDIEKNEDSDSFIIHKTEGSQLALIDYFGKVAFSKGIWTKYHIGNLTIDNFEHTLIRDRSGKNILMRNGYTRTVFSKGLNDLTYDCARFVASENWNTNGCVLATENTDYYNSEAYYNAWQQNAKDMSVYILTDVEIQDTEPKEQPIERTYHPTDNIDISHEDAYKYMYNSNFLLTYKDSDGKTHILDATETAKDANGRTYYTGTTAKINDNSTITTLQKNAFTFDSNEDIKSESEGQLKLHGLKQNDPKNKNPYIMLDADDNGNFVSYSKSRKEMSFYFNDDNTLYLRGSKSDRWIGWGEFEDENGETKEGFVSVSSKAEAVKFNIYWLDVQNSQVNFYNTDKETLYGGGPYYYYYGDYEQITGSTNYLSNRMKSPIKLGEADGNGNIFAGWTINKEKSGIFDLNEKLENIYDADTGLNEEFMSEYGIVNSTDYFDTDSISTPESYTDYWGNTYNIYTVDLYPVYIKHATTKAALVNDPNIKALVGATDWKDSQKLSPTHATATNNALTAAANGTTEEKDTQVWQGSINVETYVDGKLYGTPDKLYFQYHNDDAADVILKFVDDSKLAAQTGGDADTKLQQYLLDESILPATSQDGKYTIDAVIAEQAGSEDGLKYAYNWVNEKGARLDNVKGGSTIKVYMSNKFQVKYYLDDQELTDDAHQDESYYASDATLKAIEAENAILNLNHSITDEQIKGLMDKDITEVGNSEVYKPADSKRFAFEAYKYLVHERDNKFTAAQAPTIPANLRFKSAKWQVKDSAGNIVAEVSPEELAAISEQEGGLEEYFDALTNYAYQNDDDTVNTFHLHLYTENATEEGQTTPEDKPKEVKNPEQTKNPLTSPGAIAVYFMLAGASVAGLCLAAYKRAQDR